MDVYVVFDNSSWRGSQLLGVFASYDSARRWLDNKVASGAMLPYEYSMTSIECTEVIP